MSIPYEAAKSEVMAGYQSQSYLSEQAIGKAVAESISVFQLYYYSCINNANYTMQRDCSAVKIQGKASFLSPCNVICNFQILVINIVIL